MPLTHIDQILPRRFAYPMKIRIPTKLGFKNPKFVVELSVTNSYPGGFWEDYG
jgi:DMSO/TMAO reductase YedYZ molybdopterin-dependent catalytic subunit